MTTSPPPLAHLLPEAAIAAALPDEDRFTYIDSDRWLPYQRANEVIDLLEDFLKRPRINRPPNMMLVGRSDNGKSHILERFSNLHPGVVNPQGPNITAPVMLLETLLNSTQN